MTSAPRPLRDGLLVGLVAYAAVAVFYAAFDLLAARGALYTVNVLGKAVFRGLRDPAVVMLPLPLDTGAILLYNALHLVVSLVIGLVVVGLLVEAERHPARRRVMLAVIVAGFLITVVAVGLASRPFRPVLPWWSIVAANTAAVMLAAWYLERRLPGIGRRMLSAPA
ncbi:MAG TPA: hypothetical protein VIP80_15165 [Gemmatimonadales bacterium]|jgi:hypothetical protein